VIDVEKPLFDGDALVALDLRIVAVRDARASAVRFSDAYWDADDTLAWLRMVRDELTRTGRLNQVAMAFLEAPVARMRLTPALDPGLVGMLITGAEEEVDRDPAVSDTRDGAELVGAGRG
jgi:hypothetical protein